VFELLKVFAIPSLSFPWIVPRLLGPSWSWSYGRWIYNYLCNQCPSPQKLWVRTLFMARRCTPIQHYVIKFVSSLRQVGGFFFWVLRFSPPIKLTATIFDFMTTYFNGKVKDKLYPLCWRPWGDLWMVINFGVFVWRGDFVSMTWISFHFFQLWCSVR
jgi:hypothetical protein